MPSDSNPPTVPGSQTRWETAFERFETPAQERRKFYKRLVRLGVTDWDLDARIVDIFCGRGRNLELLEEMGFRHLCGVDLSARLLSQYKGSASLICHDCRDLPFEDASFDIVIVQGGLHHLPSLPDDLNRVIESVKRVLVPGGLFVAVEPWHTPFLQFVHAVAFSPARRLWGKLDAFATMTEEEWLTYHTWLSMPTELERIFRTFEVQRWSVGWGKLEFVGRTPL